MRRNRVVGLVHTRDNEIRQVAWACSMSCFECSDEDLVLYSMYKLLNEGFFKVSILFWEQGFFLVLHTHKKNCMKTS